MANSQSEADRRNQIKKQQKILVILVAVILGIRLMVYVAGKSHTLATMSASSTMQEIDESTTESKCCTLRDS
ncbi:unnamed protein product [Adineta ricciae]|uniref:Uncharacterized protein n=1 Tax=Adineta ricciae TaxID=249248 RepID=A0A815KNV4_ADIRI|nr:unnamed protein product [Adineta ricciae]